MLTLDMQEFVPLPHETMLDYIQRCVEQVDPSVWMLPLAARWDAALRRAGVPAQGHAVDWCDTLLRVQTCLPPEDKAL